MATCYSVTALVVQIATFTTAIVSLLTPWWIENDTEHTREQTIEKHAGLWQNCTAKECFWTEIADIPR